MKYVYVGIDPGASGGIVVLDRDCVAIYEMPDTEKKLYNLILGISITFDDAYVHVMCEKVWGHIGGGEGEKGGGASNGSAMFKFGMSFGCIKMALVACGFNNAEYVVPKVWQDVVGVGGKRKGEKKQQHKARLKARARELFPNSTGITLGVCDAMLISYYCRKRFTER